MELKILVDKAVKIVNDTGGVSVDINNLIILSPKDYWMFPKYPSKTMILPNNIDLGFEINNFINEYRDKFLESDTYLGIWLNPKSSDYYFDITTVIDNKDRALKEVKKISKKEGRNIVAIYNPLREEVVYL